MIKILIVGAGRGGSAMLRAFEDLAKVRVVGIVDIDTNAPGLALAREMGIATGVYFEDFLNESVDVVIEATGDPRVNRKISELKSPQTTLVPGAIASLMMHLLLEKEELIRQLTVSRQELNIVLNSTHDAMIAINAEGILTLYNTSAERLTGIPAEEMIGLLASEVVPNSRLHVVLQTGESELNQLQLFGNTRIITNRVPVRDESGDVVGAVAVFRDITEVQQLAEEVTNLKEIQELLQAIINSTQDAISVVDTEGRGILINPAYTRLTGLTEGDIIGKPAEADIAEGESMHMKVLTTRKPVRGVGLKVGPAKKEVLVNVAPIEVDGILKGSVGIIHDISEIKKLTDELNQAKQLIRKLEAKYTFDDIIGTSNEMVAAIEQAHKAAQTPATVLLRGESGTGKELFAHAIHNDGERKYNQFIRVNCAAISESLLESELFGYEEGAFTGAKRGGKKGLFEEASGGTIFLDEIGELSMSMQAKILRVLQEKEILRVGGAKATTVNVRVIAATNVNLERAMQQGAFREDLYYRLNVLPIIIPPLRFRKVDLAAIASRLIQKYNQEYGRSVERIASDTLIKMQNYAWPGNVRELENSIGRAMINMKFTETVIEPYHLILPGEVPEQNGVGGTATERGAVSAEAANSVSGEVRPLDEVVGEAERQHIERALEQTKGNKTEAAKRLGIAVRSLYYKLDKYGLQ
ncbi:sigma-54-dependent Fis family transcriptional regulator [Tumebacillus algifaecis]|uniref:Sigma-54-dependent Fis family transcriptional regulator n=1 Tax=Tumebacillus algifaecis TaxID=1214604 RepID=A0A223D113_9BACL|nr:sigma 54-interacting transcriptional regulator [Tumebacillus algifaecis]ASS75006.1 sigma-54-dependent Fis family transcriptional regulator [Tumebacillus algifaecis]